MHIFGELLLIFNRLSCLFFILVTGLVEAFSCFIVEIVVPGETTVFGLRHAHSGMHAEPLSLR